MDSTGRSPIDLNPPAFPGPAATVEIRRGQALEVEVTDLAYGGRALAKINGLVVFVDNALPGDRVLATVYRKRRQYAEARAERVLTPSSFRVAAPCSHVPVCGGCRFQDYDYAEQLRHKQRQVEECLEHLGRISTQARAVLPASKLFHYRNKMEYSFGRDDAGLLTLGLHRRGFYDRPFDLERCFIATPVSSDIVTYVRDFARREGLPPYDLRRHAGLLRFLAVREGMRTGEVMVNIVASEPHPAFERLATGLTEAFPNVASVVLNLTRRKAQVAVGEEERLLAGKATILERLSDLTFEISSNSFFQTNTEQAEHLLETALEGLKLTGSERVLDVYAGTGTFTLPIAKRAAEAIGIESSDVAVRDAERNAGRNGITNASFWQGEAMEILRDRLGLGPGSGLGHRDSALPREAPAIHAVLVDPPRAGLHPGVATRLIHLGAPRLVYISCNPSTLGRDLGILCESRYVLEWVQPVDMFPHTPHIECVAALRRADNL
ncbi:MAG TPA: 23S rRNA (uracil(1939)-C(5))-methyltransferase RlmD [Candidatus Limnocylindrales bacterium]|nr:23S rRNA (uracil(1939)-C(5))-methyltransferase RlmD [Candidatus Limnocylindrales bacterium]